MKFIDEYRDTNLAQKYSKRITQITTRDWNIMEICGGQTHSIVKYGIDKLLPSKITLIHGPGCPVCVTPIRLIDSALKIASLRDVIFCSFGDMLRVPGTDEDLLTVKAKGGDIRIVYSPLDGLRLAEENPNKQVVFFAVGFETTTPATAMAVYQAAQRAITNFSLLVSHVLVPPAIEAILGSPKCQVQGFLAAGHVCTVMGYEEYHPIAHKYGVPIVITGFEPIDVLQGIYLCLQQLESGQAHCENQYIRSVEQQGNSIAKQIIREVFEVVPRQWRGIGEINRSGLGLREKYASFDALERFAEELSSINSSYISSICISGEIMQGCKKPYHCSAFGKECTPERPLGAPMVSSEGACSAYYRYRSYQG
ncbi:hydrogenase formation protein HypD [Cyanobacterium sp. uoEpiScrs1]|uniref:hydrogenase formation protein HypD n=1 Tax=Cyanobacterium sp. uoEpiScrs1 TaxID=2976343 RepID=UPI00226A3760|nr:hydrogenase formation protein HypD [Cyanobacterium sp. uoEpiScrs1]